MVDPRRFQQALAGGAKANKYRAIFSFPAEAAVDSNIVDKVSITTKTFDVPELTKGKIETPFQGHIIKTPGDRVWPELPVTFQSDKSFEVYRAFVRWENLTAPMRAGTGSVTEFERYSADLVIQGGDNDENGNFIVQVSHEFYDAFPLTVGGYQYSNDAADTLIEFPVTFDFFDAQLGI